MKTSEAKQLAEWLKNAHRPSPMTTQAAAELLRLESALDGTGRAWAREIEKNTRLEETNASLREQIIKIRDSKSPQKTCGGFVIPHHFDSLTGASIPDPFRFGEVSHANNGPVGVMVSMDVSKDNEPENRIFGRIYEVQDDDHDGYIYLAIEESRNFTETYQRQPLTDEQQIAEALRRFGLTLVKTAVGYDVMKLGQIIAQGITAEQK